MVVECDAVSEICDSNRVRPEKKNNKDSTEIRKTIKDSSVLKSFNDDSYPIYRVIPFQRIFTFTKEVIICQHWLVYLSVRLFAILLKKLSTDSNEIFRASQKLHMDQLLRFSQ